MLPGQGIGISPRGHGRVWGLPQRRQGPTEAQERSQHPAGAGVFSWTSCQPCCAATATTRRFIGSFLEGPFRFRALSSGTFARSCQEELMELHWQGNAQPCRAAPLTQNLAAPVLLRRGGDFLHVAFWLLAFFWQPQGAQTLCRKAGHTHRGAKGPASTPAPPAGTACPAAGLRATLPSHTLTF